MADLGGITYAQFARHSHDWDGDMSKNLLKMSALLQPSVISRTTALPASASDNDCYIDPATKLLNIWFNGEWYTITMKPGVLVYVQDAQEYAHYNSDFSDWQTAYSLNLSPDPVPRTLSFYAPGVLRPAAPAFVYVCGQEFKLPAGAAGCSARLDVAPLGGDLVVTFTGGGSITFAEGETTGTFALAADLLLQPVQNESPETPPSTLNVNIPSDALGAEGLAITLRGEMRPPNEG